MIFIFGGVYQGKLAYAQERFSTDEVYNCCDTSTLMPHSKIINNLDQWILALVRAGEEVPVQDFIEKNPNSIVICNDVSGGIVPMDADLRKWREEVGRAMAKIAQQSDEVIRLFCGIATQLKQKNDFKFISNPDCKYYPCHKIEGEAFSCKFCFCPLYGFEDCGGTFEYNKKGIKLCMDCIFPHKPESYDIIIDKLYERAANK